MKRNIFSYSAIVVFMFAVSLVPKPLIGQSLVPKVQAPHPLPGIPASTDVPQNNAREDDAAQNNAVQEMTAQDDNSETVPRTGPQKKIRDVLQGGQPAPTGDGVLEDVLGVIQNQGSVLDGSVLDEPPLAETAGHTQPHIRNHSIVDQNAFAAEQLLKAARLLQQVCSDQSSMSLVTAMRQQAIELLSDQPSPPQ